MANRQYALAAPEPVGTYTKARFEELSVSRSNTLIVVVLLDSNGDELGRKEGNFTTAQFLSVMAGFNGSTMNLEDYLIGRLVTAGFLPGGGSYEDVV